MSSWNRLSGKGSGLEMTCRPIPGFLCINRYLSSPQGFVCLNFALLDAHGNRSPRRFEKHPEFWVSSLSRITSRRSAAGVTAGCCFECISVCVQNESPRRDIVPENCGRGPASIGRSVGGLKRSDLKSSCLTFGWCWSVFRKIA